MKTNEEIARETYPKLMDSDIAKKVYCLDCKWSFKGMFGLTCGEPTMFKESDGLGKGPRGRLPNKNNDCSYYKRKWWKIWA
jgi:hypothetical protein